jgi:hypothetical protein
VVLVLEVVVNGTEVDVEVVLLEAVVLVVLVVLEVDDVLVDVLVLLVYVWLLRDRT